MPLDPAGAEMRRLLLAAILLPCIVGWTLLQGQRQGWYSADVGLAIFTAANILVFLALVWWNSQAVRRAEQSRRDLGIRNETTLRAHLRRIEALAELDRAILGMRSTREIAETALHHLRRMVPCSCANLVVFDKPSGAHRLLATDASGDTDYIARAHPVFAYEQAQIGSIGLGQCIVIGDLRAEEPRVDLFNQLRDAGAVSYVGLPLRGEQRLLGMLELIDQEPDRFDQEQVQAARAIADQLAIALQQALLREDIDRHTASLEKRVKERTRELERINRELTAANRDLEEFTASAAHDLRAPLNAMAGNFVLLRSLIAPEPEDVWQRMQRIDAAVGRMNDVIEGMLALAQLTKVELLNESIDLDRLAGEVIQELQEQYPAHRVRYNVAGGKAIRADPRLMRSLLANLLGNAWKYTTRTEAPSVELMRLDDAAVPSFVIRDNGVGFDMFFAQHLFEPFHRMHTIEEFPGVGIGLATAARIVHRYGGKIWAESTVGAGAAFFFTLPQAAVTRGDSGIADAG